MDPPQLDQFIKILWHSLLSYRATLLESCLQLLEVSLQVVPATLLKQCPFNQQHGEEQQASQYDRRLPGGPCDTMALSLTRSLYNCFTRLPLSGHDELLQASAQNLTELLF